MPKYPGSRAFGASVRVPVPAEAPKEVAAVVAKLPPAILVTKAAAAAAIKTGYTLGKPARGK